MVKWFVLSSRDLIAKATGFLCAWASFTNSQISDQSTWLARALVMIKIASSTWWNNENS